MSARFNLHALYWAPGVVLMAARAFPGVFPSFWSGMRFGEESRGIVLMAASWAGVCNGF